MAPHSKCVFNLHWLDENSPYCKWLEKASSDSDARCKLCKKNISVSSMGESALKKHLKSKKHQEYISAAENTPSVSLFSNNSISRSQTTSDSTASSNQVPKTGIHLVLSNNSPLPSSSTNFGNPSSSIHDVAENRVSVDIMSKYISNDRTVTSEILFAINAVVQHVSLRTSESYVKLTKRCFPDSEIAQAMCLGKDKTRYTITHGISEYFSQQLTSDILKADIYVILFDESLNEVAQKCQMDVYIRFFQDGQVKTRYLTSKFLARTKSENLLEAFESSTENLDATKLRQLGMDGPNVNQKMLRLLKSKRESLGLPCPIDIGTCCLWGSQNC